MANWHLRVGAFLVGLGSMAPTCRSGFENQIPDIAAFDWAPASGTSYGLTWHEGGTLSYSEASRFVLTARFASPIESAVNVNFQVMVGSTQVGTIEAAFAAGSTTPTTKYKKNAGADSTPTGTPDLSNGRFWLACTTERGHIRGNAGKSSTGSSNVYVRVGADHSRRTPYHHVTCSK